MRKLVLSLLSIVAALALAGAAAPSSREAARATLGPCGLPNAIPSWFDTGTVEFWGGVAKGPMTLASSYDPANLPTFPPTIPHRVYFDLHLNKRVGTPTVPADPSGIVAKANKLFDYASRSTECATPYIAENELFGASTPTPWTPTAAQYRSNVLTFLRALSARGANPFLLVSSKPYTGGDAAEWWRQVSQVATIVREVYFPAPRIYALGAIKGNRALRAAMRRGAADFLAIGISPSKLGLVLGFQTCKGCGGREALKPKEAWFEYVKWNVLSARAVARELRLPTVWTWGWNDYGAAPDPDKAAAGCVYLWTRAPGLCSGPAAAGPRFNDSRSDGQLRLPSGARCLIDGRQIRNDALAALNRVTGDGQVSYSALLGRLAARESYDVTSARVSAAERALIALRFRGSRAAYRAALARVRASLAVGRGVIADELRRARIETSIKVGAPGARAVADYYRTYADAPARSIVVEPAPWWLGDRTAGLALGSLAPPQVFRLASGSRVNLQTMEGLYKVRALDDALPLGAIPLTRARPAIRAALVSLARDDSYDTWLGRKEKAVLARAICANDLLPTVSSIDLTAYLPFLALDAGPKPPK